MTSIEDLAREISDSVRQYTADVAEAIEAEVDDTANRIRDTAEANAPKKTGKYARGFKVAKANRSGKARRTVWNKKYYRLVHLLEFGHALKKGGRVAGKPHLRPAYDQHIDQFNRNVNRIIENGGRP